MAAYHARQLLQESSLSAYIFLTASLVQGGQVTEAEGVYTKLLENRPVFAVNYKKILQNWPLPDGMREMLLQDLQLAGLKVIAYRN